VIFPVLSLICEVVPRVDNLWRVGGNLGRFYFNFAGISAHYALVCVRIARDALYASYSLYDQADKLVSKTTFPASAGNPQFACYHYCLGCIKAVQLSYSAAHANLQQAIRRAPAAKLAPGFYQAVHKLFVVVELLMGDIPNRGLFRHSVLEKALTAYFVIVKAVRTGSLSQFQATLARHAAQFETDRTFILIVRLRQNVTKTGIRRLSLSYSRLSLRDIRVKLYLDSEEDAEYIVSKAIRDGVIDGASCTRTGGWSVADRRAGMGPRLGRCFRGGLGVVSNCMIRVLRRCDTRSTHIERSWLQQRARGSGRKSLRRRYRKGTSTTRIWEENFDLDCAVNVINVFPNSFIHQLSNFVAGWVIPAPDLRLSTTLQIHV